MQCQEGHEAGSQEEIYAICLLPQCPKRFLCQLCFSGEFHLNHYTSVKPIKICLNEIRQEINNHKANDIESILVQMKEKFELIKNNIIQEINKIEQIFQENIKQIQNNELFINERIKDFENIANSNKFNDFFGNTVLNLVKNVNEGFFKDFKDQYFKTLQNSINKLQNIWNPVKNNSSAQKEKVIEKDKDKDKEKLKEKIKDKDKEKENNKEKGKQKSTPITELTAVNPHFQKLHSFFEKQRFNYDDTPLELSQIRGNYTTDKMNGQQYYRGEAKIIMVNGNKQSIFYGRGILVDQRDELILEGIWENQEMRFGYKFYLDFKKKPSVKIGFFRHQKLQGKGKLMLMNGHKYCGEFKDDRKSGRGIENWVDGSQYEGEYLNDLRNGRGRYYFQMKEYLDCGWLDDYENGEGVYVDSQGQKLVGNYDMGKKVGIHKLYKNVDDKEPFEFQKYQNGKLVETQIKNDIQKII